MSIACWLASIPPTPSPVAYGFIRRVLRSLQERLGCPDAAPHHLGNVGDAQVFDVSTNYDDTNGGFPSARSETVSAGQSSNRWVMPSASTGTNPSDSQNGGAAGDACALQESSHVCAAPSAISRCARARATPRRRADGET